MDVIDTSVTLLIPTLEGDGDGDGDGEEFEIQTSLSCLICLLYKCCIINITITATIV